jgi:F-type H+-transporting ATPase subunit a
MSAAVDSSGRGDGSSSDTSPAQGRGAGEVEGADGKMSTKRKLLLLGGVWIGGVIVLGIIYGFHGTRNTSFEPQNEFKLDNWVSLGAFSLNKAVLYLVMAATLTCVSMIWIARRMQQRPNKVQAAVETLYQLMRENITGSAMEEKMAAKWFPFVGALFLFIMFSNLIGYIPLPTNTEHEISVLGTHIPSFSLYASTANIAIPLALALVVFVSYTYEGVRAKGPIGYLKGLIPGGVTGGMAVAIFFLEVLSNLMRILSLTIRLFANILAGHLIILFMAGALAVILGISALGWFTLPFGIALFAFEVGLVAALQAFIFATLTAIYLGGAVAEDH